VFVAEHYYVLSPRRKDVVRLGKAAVKPGFRTDAPAGFLGQRKSIRVYSRQQRHILAACVFNAGAKPHALFRQSFRILADIAAAEGQPA